jgi:hypothetical protein
MKKQCNQEHIAFRRFLKKHFMMGERWLPSTEHRQLDTELMRWLYQTCNFSSLIWSNIFKLGPCVIDSMFQVLRTHPFWPPSTHPFWPPSLQTYTMQCNGKCIAHSSFKILTILNTNFKQTSTNT